MFKNEDGHRWVNGISKRGYPFAYIERPMPWIEPAFLDCVVYLYPSEAAAEDGEKMGGSGFLIGLPIPDAPQKVLLCVVTNKHVAERGSTVVRVSTKDEKKDTIPLDAARWYTHADGDDLAVCPIGLSSSHKFQFLYPYQFLTKAMIDEWDIGPGDDAFVVGRFVNHEGKARNLPTVRFGNIAQMPWEPITIEGTTQESFLVEARSISGYSGSPVFVFFETLPRTNFTPEFKKALDEGQIKIPGQSSKRLKWAVGGTPMRFMWLLGVDWCHLTSDQKILNKHTGDESKDWLTKSNTGMMGVVPAWRLNDIIQGDEMQEIMKLAAEHERAAKVNSVGELDSATEVIQAEPADANPQGKEDFMRLLDAAAKGRPKAD